MLPPAAPPGPKVDAELKPEPHRCPSLLGALGVAVGALAACLLTVLCVHHHLEALRGELSQLREELRSQMHQGEGPLRSPQVRRGSALHKQRAGAGEGERGKWLQGVRGVSWLLSKWTASAASRISQPSVPQV